MDPETQLIEIAVSGRWTRRAWAGTRTLLSSCLAEQPAGILMDLSRLDDPHSQSASLWRTAAREAGQSPVPIRMAVCLPDDAALAVRLRRVGACHRLAIYPDLAGGRAALLSERPPADELRITLPPLLNTTMTARNVVSAACREWDLHGLRPRALFVASELVLNAVEHAGTSMTLSVARLMSRRRSSYRPQPLLRLTVHDLSPELPRLLAPSLTTPLERGQGLRIVDAAAETWGALPTRTGKLVWAILKERPV
ncbi:ATP-binding protein [Actinoplanes sp. NEAU-A12]|uniref:ATP-binding protein n=1 Tax=Actinoplanes sandaracinus TaxID=3045177 RepID=A0ABT6WM52_9ACTN|nr:ATP-binding protein [Actinoplanes sandaracinus]MDI6100804.1 ATP-binding protein [Actinoplanes sandaracinus]